MLKFSLLILMLIPLLGCRAKIYWLPGEQTFNTPIITCPSYPDANGMLDKIAHLRDLTTSLKATMDPVVLTDLMSKISAVKAEVERGLIPLYTDQTQDVTYHWKFRANYIPRDAHVRPVALSIFGVKFDPREIQVATAGEYCEITLKRKASILDICSLQETTQALVSIGANDDDPEFFYRLGVE